jgi:glutaminyl-peptide cyclotransferase
LVFAAAACPFDRPVKPCPRQSPFNAERAWADLETVVGFGPRPSGSPELAALRSFIQEQLDAAGLEVWEHAFEAETPIGVLPMVNVVGVVKGSKPGILVLGNHYETKYFPDMYFVGANDGGSTTAWMIEMARALGPRREGRSVWLCFFDGEEAFVNWTATDSVYGSRAFVALLKASGQLDEIDAMINIDMIGDCYLGIEKDVVAAGFLVDPIWAAAESLGYGGHFLDSYQNVSDDHIPFHRAGVPVIDLIDFTYGRTVLDHLATWHTEADTLDKCCASSLQVVADVVYHALPAIEAELDAR